MKALPTALAGAAFLALAGCAVYEPYPAAYPAYPAYPPPVAVVPVPPPVAYGPIGVYPRWGGGYHRGWYGPRGYGRGHWR